MDSVIRIYGPYLRSICRSRLSLSVEDAEDVTQDALFRILRNLPELEVRSQPGSFRAWVTQALQWSVRDWASRYRQGQPGPVGGTDHLRLIDLVAAPDFSDDGQSRTLRLVRDVIAMIKTDCAPQTWRAFELFAIEGRSAAEVGELLGQSAGWVRGVKARIVRRLREELGNPFENEG